MRKNEQEEVAENQEVKVVETAEKTKIIDIYYKNFKWRLYGRIKVKIRAGKGLQYIAINNYICTSIHRIGEE